MEEINYKVLEANQVDVYHYHGSRFEYTWKLTLLSPTDRLIHGEYDTSVSHKCLVGKTIKIKHSDFEVV